MSVLATVHAPTMREQLERLAYLWLWEKIDKRQAAAVLVALEAAGLLATDDPGTHFADLVLGIRERDGIETGDLHWSEVLPDATGSGEMREAQALDAAMIRIENALDALCGRTS